MLMITSISFVIFMVMCCAASGLSIGLSETATLKRQKRALYVIGKDVLKGIQTMRKLKKDAKPVLPDKYKVNLYSKDGDFQEAMDDFNSFQPRSVFDCNHGKGGSKKWAFVGDRTLCLEEVGESGKPTLQIFRGLGTSKEKLDTFTYGD